MINMKCTIWRCIKAYIIILFRDYKDKELPLNDNVINFMNDTHGNLVVLERKTK